MFTVRDIVTRPAPAKRHRFWMSIDGLGENGQTITIPSDYIERVTIPGVVFDQQSVIVESRKFNYPGTFMVTPMQIEFYEDESHIISAILQSWRNQIRNPVTGTYGYPETYKKNAYIYLLNSINEFMRVAFCEGIWPSSIDPVNLDGATSDRIIISQVFSVDNLILYDRGSGTSLTVDQIPGETF